MQLRVGFPMRYANDKDCYDSPDARKRKVKTSSFPADIALRKFMSSFVILFSTSPSK